MLQTAACRHIFLNLHSGGGGVGEGGKGPSYMLCPPSSQCLATPLHVGKFKRILGIP
jgi:hypothetical protein